jgi:hypothetical protein
MINQLLGENIDVVLCWHSHIMSGSWFSFTGSFFPDGGRSMVISIAQRTNSVTVRVVSMCLLAFRSCKITQRLHRIRVISLSLIVVLSIMSIDHKLRWKIGNLISGIVFISCHNGLVHGHSNSECNKDSSQAPQDSQWGICSATP